MLTRCLFALILVTISAACLYAQTGGDISGHVADSTGAIIPNAAITLTNAGKGTSRSTVTTGAGDYSFPDVPPGVYRIEVQHQGFKTAARGNFELQVQQSLRQDFTMQVGAVTQSVTVEATGTLLQAENATVGTVIENAAVNEMPLNGRNYLSLVALSSNANTLSPASGQAGSRLGGDRSTQAISVGGQRIMFDYYTLDGVNTTDPDFVTYLGLPSLDGIQEFKVQTGVYPAEFGHEATQVNVVSKSGSNTYHGAMYDFIRNNIADANPYFFPYNAAPPKVYPYKWNDYGFELDGPIRIPKVYNGRDRFFFMVDDE
ncbi:MAG: carboxypeptidase-like regulatory domain-containing protein [Terracidiphilus sp.]